MVNGVFIGNSLFIFGNVIGGFTEIFRVGIEAKKIILNLEGDAEVFAEVTEGAQVFFGRVSGKSAELEWGGDSVESGLINIDIEDNFFGELAVSFKRFVGEFNVGDFAERSFIEGCIKEFLDFVEVFRVRFGEKFFGEENAEVANPNGARKTEMAWEFFGDGFFATTESGAVGDVIVDESGSLEDFVGGGEIKIGVVVFFVKKLSEFYENATEALSAMIKTLKFGKGKLDKRIVFIFGFFAGKDFSEMRINSDFIREIGRAHV